MLQDMSRKRETKTDEEAVRMAEAIRDVAIAFGVCVKEVESLIKQIDNYFKPVVKIKELAKAQNRLLRELNPKRSYESPYAKFDKYRKKRNK